MQERIADGKGSKFEKTIFRCLGFISALLFFHIDFFHSGRMAKFD